jgi:predicted transcriptional regulator
MLDRVAREKELLGLLKDFIAQHGRLPAKNDTGKDLLPSTSAFCTIFGSFSAAQRRAAGVDYDRLKAQQRERAVKSRIKIFREAPKIRCKCGAELTDGSAGFLQHLRAHAKAGDLKLIVNKPGRSFDEKYQIEWLNDTPKKIAGFTNAEFQSSLNAAALLPFNEQIRRLIDMRQVKYVSKTIQMNDILDQRIAALVPFVRGERKVRMTGTVELYTSKAPFAVSGESIQGAVEIIPEYDLLKCHECGLWAQDLSRHINSKHSMSARKYKLRHKLTMSTALISEKNREMRIARSKKIYHSFRKKGIDIGKIPSKRKRRAPKYPIEKSNKKNTCPAQLLDNVKKASAQVGRRPTHFELKEVGGVGLSSYKFRFGSIRRAINIGMGDEGQKSHHDARRRYSNGELLDLLKNFVEKHGRLPGASDAKRRMVPYRQTYNQRFGTFARAAIKALGKERYRELKKEFRAETIAKLSRPRGR